MRQASSWHLALRSALALLVTLTLASPCAPCAVRAQAASADEPEQGIVQGPQQAVDVVDDEAGADEILVGDSPRSTDTREQTRTDAGGSSDDWIVWVIVGAVVGVGVGVAVGVIASQQSLEPPLPGTVGAVELLRF
jgi:hypothetical protein